MDIKPNKCKQKVVDRSTGKTRSCRNKTFNKYCHTHILKYHEGECSYCGDECNPCSQICRRCALYLTWR